MSAASVGSEMIWFNFPGEMKNSFTTSSPKKKKTSSLYHFSSVSALTISSFPLHLHFNFNNRSNFFFYKMNLIRVFLFFLMYVEIKKGTNDSRSCLCVSLICVKYEFSHFLRCSCCCHWAVSWKDNDFHPERATASLPQWNMLYSIIVWD